MTQTQFSILPQHIAIVMDGNGRWAKKRFLPRIAGHRAGLQAVRATIRSALKFKIPILSLFAFSSENWQRPAEEVDQLMSLFLEALQDEIPALQKQSVRLRFIGSRSRFQSALLEKMQASEIATENGDQLQLLIAADYGGQWDICHAVERWLQETRQSPEKLNAIITPSDIEKYLSFSDLPSPDLFIRTSGEQRISNFMLWQLAYTELYFTEILWPDFNEEAFEQALSFYSTRQRRFGR